MQFTVDRQKLQKALQRVSNIIGSRSTLPLLGNVLIKAADNSLELSTTDLELRLVTTVEAEVAEAGVTTLPAKKLVSLIGSFSAEKVEFSVNENDQAKITCGTAKFTLFGFNVVDAQAKLEEEEAQKESSSIPEYKAPFELGTGEGFEETGEDSFTPPTARDEVEQKLIDVISSSSGFSPDGEDFSFGGPFPKEDKTFGVYTNLMGAFIGSGAMKYIEKFKRVELRRKPSFNFAAFFLSPYWFFYRKLIKPGIIFMTINICLSVISTPFLLEFMEKAAPLMENLAQVTTDSAAATILMELESLYYPVICFMAVQFVLNLIAGFVANPLYRKYTVSSLREIESLSDRKNCMAHLLKKGGVAPLYALIAVLGENLLSSIAGMLMQ